MVTMDAWITNTEHGWWRWRAYLRFHDRGPQRAWSRSLGALEPCNDYRSVELAEGAVWRTARRLGVTVDRIDCYSRDYSGGRPAVIVSDFILYQRD